MFKVERIIHSHYSNRFSSTHRFSQLELKQRFEISTHPNWYLPKKKTLTSSYLKCVCVIYRFSTEKGHFQSPPEWAEAGAKARAGLIIPLGQSVSNQVVQTPKRIELEGLGKRRTERAIRAQLFEGRLAHDLGLDPGFFFFCSKTFSWIIFSVIFKSIQSSTCWQKELNWIYFLSFHLNSNFALTPGLS